MKLKVFPVTAPAVALSVTALLSVSAPTVAQNISSKLLDSSMSGSLILASAERVNFRPNTTGADLEGTLRQSQYRDYVLRASAGQRMSVSTMGTGSFLVQVFAPNGRNLHTGVENWSGRLPSTGDYRLRVSLPPGERSGETQSYKLTVVVSGARMW